MYSLAVPDWQVYDFEDVKKRLAEMLSLNFSYALDMVATLGDDMRDTTDIKNSDKLL